MDTDLELYRKEVLISTRPEVRLSAIDIAPEQAQRTFVFLHGFGGRASQWQYQMAYFGQENRAIALDLRGHGQSSRPHSEYTMPDTLLDIHTSLERLGINGRFILVGHSFGGAVAAEYAAAYPEQVERLVLVASAGEFRLNPLIRLALKVPARIASLLVPFAPAPLGAPPHVLKAWYANTVRDWKGWDLFRSLNLPVLIIRGHLDLVLDRPAFELVARTFPAAEEVDVGASGHMVMLERRAAVNRAIERFTNAGKRSWREASDIELAARRAALVRERPWLSHYDDGVPYTIAVPNANLPRLVESASRRFPLNPAFIFEGRVMTYRRLDLETNRFAHALVELGLQPGERIMLLLPNLPQTVIAFFGSLKAGGVVTLPPPGTKPEELSRLVIDSGARIAVGLASQRKMVRSMLDQARLELPSADVPSEAGISSPFQIIWCDPIEYLPRLARWLMRLKGILPKSDLAQTEAESTRKFGSTESNESAEPTVSSASSRNPPASNGNPGAYSSTAWLKPEEYLFRRLLENRPASRPLINTSGKDLAVIAYTGGTTAEAKGVMLSHRNLIANALQTRSWIPDAREGRERFLSVLPFAHSYGLLTALLTPVALGATLILKPRFEVADILKTIQAFRPTIFPGVPRMYLAINDYPGVRRFGIQSIRACLSGSAPLPVEVQETFEKLTKGRLVEGYGLTEASPVTHANPLNDVRKVGSIGVPLPSTEARLVDLIHGRDPVPAGQIGELAVRGPQVMMGYWANPEATRQVITPDGWLLTGDVAQMDEEGYFRIIARKTDMWYADKPDQPAFPRDVEEVLYEIPQVKEAAVVAVAGQPIAFIISRGERPTSEAVIGYARRRLPPELAPRLVIFLDEFPRSFIGKVLRRELARRVEYYGKTTD